MNFQKRQNAPFRVSFLGMIKLNLNRKHPKLEGKTKRVTFVVAMLSSKLSR